MVILMFSSHTGHEVLLSHLAGSGSVKFSLQEYRYLLIIFLALLVATSDSEHRPPQTHHTTPPPPPSSAAGGGGGGGHDQASNSQMQCSPRNPHGGSSMGGCPRGHSIGSEITSSCQHRQRQSTPSPEHGSTSGRGSQRISLASVDTQQAASRC